MPQRLNMVISNGNQVPQIQRQLNNANLATAPRSIPASTALSAPIIARIHTTKPGCGSCGRH